MTPGESFWGKAVRFQIAQTQWVPASKMQNFGTDEKLRAICGDDKKFANSAVVAGKNCLLEGCS